MHRVRRVLLLFLVLGIMLSLALLITAALSTVIRGQRLAAIPTVAVLPSLTPSATPTRTPTPTSTFTPTHTSTPTRTTTPTYTATPSDTPTLANRVIEISAVMPGVFVPPTATPLPRGLTLLPAPPMPFEPLPDATRQPPPYEGWISYESDHPQLQYSPVYWTPIRHAEASQGQYHRFDGVAGVAALAFEGEGLRIRYVAASNMGVFAIVVDGRVIDTVDAYRTELTFPGTRVYFVEPGEHTLHLRSAGRQHPDSSGTVLALDAVQVYRAGPDTLILPPADTATPTPSPVPAARIELVAAPPTIQPTPTPLAPSEITVGVVIAYDENGNRAVDPAEGVSGISVRVAEVGTNRVIAQAFTDGQGYAQLTVITGTEARVVVPYFGEVWNIPRGRGGGGRFTLLLEPGNQPGLIP